MSYLATQPARASGTFTVGGDLPVMRLGYGAMQVPATRSSACCAAPSSSASRSSPCSLKRAAAYGSKW
jgi:hypothetical protein